MSDNQANIQMTENAKKHARKIISSNASALGLRLAVKKTGCSGYAYVTEIVTQNNPEDIHCKLEDLSVFVDKSSMQFLQGTLIDFIDEGFGQTKLIFNNPNAANYCGCGESFNLADE